ncbi:BMP family ABC transporter substrate-binding protein [Mesoplasma tabanidae]|uniref:Ribose/galactose ABC transporter substrate-binding protein n=1 Tax=Mesoplasma tabanidae TaxID=219745 RepID=A0A2K8P842_9MOLU|nr:BMP family ABC transporter substrate-binding protein [Mesoplasma tabanidae]ATZ21913.1 ribose/galactose ABC transporter substrate-binding protein [Mesoplasma tabanidae]
MKKLLLALLTTAIISTSLTSVVSCGIEKHFGGIYLITDSGKVDDKSFNQSTYEAGTEFTNNILGINKKIAYIQPESTAPKTMKRAYKTAKSNNAKTLLLPGFHHSMPGEGEHQGAEVMKNSGSTIILDSYSDAKNEIGVVFRGDVSGFYAGMSSIIYSLKNENYTNNTLSLGAFGGVSNPASVDNFIVGFLASIDVYNELKKQDSFLEEFGIDKELADKVVVTKAQKGWPKSKDDTTWFSNSFLIGQSKLVLDNLKDTTKSIKPNVLMPVAGPQVSDAISYDTSWKVIGVDTNTAESYGKDAENRFITSAEKDLKNAAIVSLAHTPEWMNNNEYPNILKDVAEGYSDKIQLTKEVKDQEGKSEFIDVDIKNEESWTGTDVWVNGTMSYGGYNLLDEELAQHIKKYFSADALTEASKKLFSDYINGKKPSSGTIIAADPISDYAKTVVKNLSQKPETGKE